MCWAWYVNADVLGGARWDVADGCGFCSNSHVIHAIEMYYKSDVSSGYCSRVGDGALVVVVWRAVQSVAVSGAVSDV